MDDGLRDELYVGCLNDAKLTERIFRELIKDFPKSELPIIDMTVRMYTEPRVLGDADHFEAIARHEFERKNQALTDLGVKECDLQSSATLVRILEGLGEEVPRKACKSGSIPCFAADDDYMMESSAREDKVGALLRARIDVKSTITETRAGRLASMSRRGSLPIYQKYCAAITTRWGGGEKTNIQNLPRLGTMRQGLMAPDGYSFVTLDFSQIEYRILCGLAGQKDKLEVLAAGRDLYCEFSSRLFNRLIGKENVEERQFGKRVTLSSGYGAGKDRCANMARSDGFYFPRKITDKAIDLYREEHEMVCVFWDRCDKLLPRFAAGGKGHITGTPLSFGGGSFILPNGLSPKIELVWCKETRAWMTRGSRGDPADEDDNRATLLSKGYTGFWGGSLTGYLCQSLARVRLSELMQKAWDVMNIKPVFLVHDEYVTLVPDERVKEVEYSLWTMAREPSYWWLDGPPFDGETRTSKRYGK